jgi:two-component system chemotaxis response regulator CheB
VSEAIAVLIVDDSALMRNLISKMIEATPGLRVGERAMNGVFALQKIPRIQPDVIVLDLEMPEMNGIEFLRERKRLGIEIPVVILSSIAQRGAEITMEALALGASDFIMKPSGSVSEDIHRVKDQLTGMLLAYGGQYRTRRGGVRPEIPPQRAYNDYEAPAVIPHLQPAIPGAAEALAGSGPAHPAAGSAPAKPAAPLRRPGRTELIVIGISTGGPNALREVFGALDADLNLPILVVQHMPPGFTLEFAKSLDRICPLDVKEAEEGDLVKPGRILIAPGDYHIEVEKKSLAAVVHLSDAPAVNGHRPSADVLFASAARAYGNHVLAVIMTGMGRDGAKELGTIYREGGITIGQDEASAIVYGMPRVAFELGHVMEQVPLDRMAARICELAKENRQ